MRLAFEFLIRDQVSCARRVIAMWCCGFCFRAIRIPKRRWWDSEKFQPFPASAGPLRYSELTTQTVGFRTREIAVGRVPRQAAGRCGKRTRGMQSSRPRRQCTNCTRRSAGGTGSSQEGTQLAGTAAAPIDRHRAKDFRLAEKSASCAPMQPKARFQTSPALQCRQAESVEG